MLLTSIKLFPSSNCSHLGLDCCCFDRLIQFRSLKSFSLSLRSSKNGVAAFVSDSSAAALYSELLRPVNKSRRRFAYSWSSSSSSGITLNQRVRFAGVSSTRSIDSKNSPMFPLELYAFSVCFIFRLSRVFKRYSSLGRKSQNFRTNQTLLST